MQAFLNDPSVKEKYLTRVREHRLADKLVKGKYWEGGKGCAVGCTVHSDEHAAYERELGIPRMLARLEDGIFENLPNALAMNWPEQFLEAIRPGADLSGVGDRFLLWLLVDPTDGVIRFAKTEKTRKAVQTIGKMYERKMAGEMIPAEDWRKARSAAYAAAAASAAAYAAYAASAAASAAYAYAAYADADAARTKTLAKCAVLVRKRLKVQDIR